jgi:hypothetical protein
MKKRTKKYNPIKANYSKALLAFKNLCLLMRLDVSEGKVNAFNFVTKKYAVINQIDYKLLQDTRFNWTVVLVVWSKENNGKDRVSTKLVQSPYPANHVELIKSLNENHQAMIGSESDKGNTVYQAAWVAYPQELGLLNVTTALPWIDLSVELLNLYKQAKS